MATFAGTRALRVLLPEEIARCTKHVLVLRLGKS